MLVRRIGIFDRAHFIFGNGCIRDCSHHFLEMASFRCVCQGLEDAHWKLPCDSCGVWQHGPCTGAVDGDVLGEFACDQCNPVAFTQRLASRVAEAAGLQIKAHTKAEKRLKRLEKKKLKKERKVQKRKEKKKGGPRSFASVGLENQINL